MASNKQYDDMVRDITTGWNTETTDLTQNSDNEANALGLIYRYPDYVHSAADNFSNSDIVPVKRYIYRHSNFVTGIGGKMKGLSFIGFLE